MRSPRWTQRDSEDDDDGPAPQADGRLEPPNRKPPTALAVATPEPPAEPYRRTQYGAGLTHVRRAAKAALGIMLMGVGGVAMIVFPLSVGTLFGATSVGLGSFVGLRALRAADMYSGNDVERGKRRRKAGRKSKPPAAPH